MSGDLQRVLVVESLDNMRGGTQRVLVVGGGGGSVDYSKTVQKTTTMPAADSSNAGDVYMYTGATDANYTTNYIYENITTTTSSSASATQTVGSGLSDISVDIDTLESFTGWTTDNSLQIFYTADGWSVDTTSLGVTYTGTPSVGDAITITYTAEVNTYAWTRVDVQPSGSSLPSQTGNAGKFLTTDGTDASWGTTINPITIIPVSNTYTSVVNLKGYNNNNTILYMNMTPSTGTFELDIRTNSLTRTGWYYFDSAFYPHATMTNLTLGKSANKWGNVYTTKINNGADIDVPTTGGTMAVIGVNTTVTLTTAGWSGGSQTVTVTGMTATGIALVSPDPTDQSAYTSAGIICTAQAANSLTFTCTSTPSADIDVNVVML